MCVSLYRDLTTQEKKSVDLDLSLNYIGIIASVKCLIVSNLCGSQGGACENV